MNITVFLSSRDGNDSSFLELSEEVGKLLVKNGHTLVYGGSLAGCMGKISETVLNENGNVISVYPDGILPGEPARTNVTEMHIAETMDERKRKLIDFADAILVLPGGLGTLEEVFQYLTELSLGIVEYKPIIFVGYDFYEGLFKFICRSILQNGLMDDELGGLIALSRNMEELDKDLDRLNKWFEKKKALEEIVDEL